MSSTRKGLLEAKYAKPKNLGVQAKEKCILLISVGKDNFEEEALKAQLRLIRKNGYSQCLILVADTLQRYNIRSDHLPEQNDTIKQTAQEKALQKGENWLNQYTPVIQEMLGKDKCQISTWDEWLHHQDFIHFKDKVKEFLHKNEDYARALESSITEYTQRYKKHSHLSEGEFQAINQAVRQNCRKYLREECAVLTLFAAENPDYKFLLYPGKATPILESTYKMLIEPNQGEVLRWIPLTLSSYKPTANPQFFSKANPHTNSKPNNHVNIQIPLKKIIQQIKNCYDSLPKEERKRFIQLLIEEVANLIKSNEANCIKV